MKYTIRNPSFSLWSVERDLTVNKSKQKNWPVINACHAERDYLQLKIKRCKTTDRFLYRWGWWGWTGWGSFWLSRFWRNSWLVITRRLKNITHKMSCKYIKEWSRFRNTTRPGCILVYFKALWNSPSPGCITVSILDKTKVVPNPQAWNLPFLRIVARTTTQQAK